MDKGQIDLFLKRGPHSFRKDRDLACKEPQEDECSTEIVATIVGGYVEGITHVAWKAQMRGMQQVMVEEHGNCITVPTMTFDGYEGRHFSSLYNDLLVV